MKSGDKMDPTTFNMMRMMMYQMHMQHQQQQQQQQVTNRFLMMSQQMQMQMMQQLVRVQAPQALIASSPPQNGECMPQPVMARPLLAIENAVIEPLSEASPAGVNVVDTDNNVGASSSNVSCSLPAPLLVDDGNISTANDPQIEEETNSSTTASLPNTASSSSSNNEISIRAADAALKRKADSTDDQPVQTRSKVKKSQM